MKYRIEQDENAESPAESDNDGLFLISAHRDFWVPANRKDRNVDLQSEIDARSSTHWIFPVEAYIHSGVRIALANEGNFPDRQWDVSRCAVIFAAKSEWRLSASARKSAQCLVDEWNKYLRGDVWGYIVEDDEGNHLDSCWGFYGREYCEQEAKASLLHCRTHALSEANAI